jgi:hypothetical protein
MRVGWLATQSASSAELTQRTSRPLAVKHVAADLMAPQLDDGYVVPPQVRLGEDEVLGEQKPLQHDVDRVVVVDDQGPPHGAADRLLLGRVVQPLEEGVLEIRLLGGDYLDGHLASGHPLLDIHPAAGGHVDPKLEVARECLHEDVVSCKVREVRGAAAISEKYTHIRKNSTAQLIMIRFY